MINHTTEEPVITGEMILELRNAARYAAETGRYNCRKNTGLYRI